MTDSPDAPGAAPTTPDYLAEVQRMMDMNGASLDHRMGIRYVEATPERVVATMPVEVAVGTGGGELRWRGAVSPLRIEVDPQRLFLDPVRSNSVRAR